MKKIYIPSLALFLAFTAVSFTHLKPKPECINGIQWSETTHNFGDIPIGPDATAEFVFKNKGKTAIKVLKVEPGCSCTISSFTSDPVKKNKKGKIMATYKTKDHPAFFKKFIMVTFEDGRTQELIITGNVVF